jgi:hypothetical protein
MPAPTTSHRSAKAAKPAAKSAVKRASASRTNSASGSGVSGSASANGNSYAERAVLIPVGAVLIARERVFSSVNGTISTYSNTSKTQAQLRRFERRGNTARRRVEREIRKTRVSAEREFRKRRRDGVDFADRLQGRIQDLV